MSTLHAARYAARRHHGRKEVAAGIASEGGGQRVRMSVVPDVHAARGASVCVGVRGSDAYM